MCGISIKRVDIMCDESVNLLIQNFNQYLEYFKESNPYYGPSLYFHDKIIEIRRTNQLDTLIEDDRFIEYLYSLLACWGMHRMTGGPHLKDFPEFSTIVRNIGRRTLTLQDVQLGNIQQQHIDLLCQVLNDETIMQSKPKIVGNSKLYHHLFPDLVPPIDKANTLWFFEKPRGSDTEVFQFVMKKYIKIHNSINWETVVYNGPMNTSRPKIIDNAIISFKLLKNSNAA